MEIIKLNANAIIVIEDALPLVGEAGSVYTVFSYNSKIIRIVNGEITDVYPEWEYSTTTSKHLNMALNELGYGHIAEMTREQKRKHFTALGLI